MTALLAMTRGGEAQTLTHRYSLFSEANGSTSLVDLVGTANGSLAGGAAITGGQLTLSGASGCYASLPMGLITGYSAVTVEAWVSFGALPVNCYLFSFGNTDSSGSGEDYIFCAPQAARITISDADPGWQGEQNATCGSWSGLTNLHMVAVFDPPAHALTVYTNGTLAGVNNAVTYSMSSVRDVYNYIGRSLYTGDPYAPLSVAELRLYKGALSRQQIALNAAAGPTQIVTNAGALESISLVLSNQMAAGATQQALVLGNFANVSNVNLETYGEPMLVSTNASVASVSLDGLISALSPGMTTVTATYGGLTATQTVRVVGFATNQFVFDSFGDGFWGILNQGSGQALRGGAGSGTEPFTNGATEQQFEVLYNLQNGTFRLRQRSSWNCLRVSSATPGAPPLISLYSGLATEQWRLVNAGGGGYYRIFNVAASNLVLQADGGTPAQVTLTAPGTNSFQLWQFQYQAHYPKKGSAGYEGDYAQWGLSWAYNYDDNTGVSLPGSVDFVPMVWGPYWEPLSDLQPRDPVWLSGATPAYLMTFNEPDNSGQANMSVATAINMWPSLQSLNVALVGPGTQNVEDSWENSFYEEIASNHYRVDYAAVHDYPSPNASALINTLESVYNAYGRPVWLTEFSPVDWGGCKCWSENDDYNFLAEFMWQAENNDWLKRYAVFPFSNSNADRPWVKNGFTGSIFLSDGKTLSPYGELYASWDGDETLHARTPYLIHNLGSSYRLTDTAGATHPGASTIYVRNATTEWALLPAPEPNHWYLISLNDGRRLWNNAGTLDLAPFGTTNALVDWWLNGPDANGYYYLDNLARAQSIQGTGSAPSISFSMINDPAPSAATQWRLVKPYQPLTIAEAVAPATATATVGNQTVTLSWGATDLYYRMYRAATSGGPYTQVGGTLSSASFTDSGLTNGVAYYYVVTGLNILGEESAYSAEVSARPVSLSKAEISFVMEGSGVTLIWPADHTGWELEAQTNSLGTNWVILPGYDATNQAEIPLIGASNASVFYRLVGP